MDFHFPFLVGWKWSISITLKRKIEPIVTITFPPFENNFWIIEWTYCKENKLQLNVVCICCMYFIYYVYVSWEIARKYIFFYIVYISFSDFIKSHSCYYYCSRIGLFSLSHKFNVLNFNVFHSSSQKVYLYFGRIC